MKRKELEERIAKVKEAIWYTEMKDHLTREDWAWLRAKEAELRTLKAELATC